MTEPDALPDPAPPADSGPISSLPAGSRPPWEPPDVSFPPMELADALGPPLPQQTVDEVLLGQPVRQRRRFLPAVLFLTTCFTTFCAGVYGWEATLLGQPSTASGHSETFFELIGHNWRQGLVYMAAVLGVLMAHEMGHFLMTIRHRIHASYPLFIPVPLMTWGTMGAVISMDGLKADRRQLFDIGLGGPLAGLVLIIPLLGIGISNLKPPDKTVAAAQSDSHEPRIHYGQPLLVKLLMPRLNPAFADGTEFQINALYMAGWVGLFVTGLNMLPISQLDGGHLIYALFGRRSRWIARGFLFTAIGFILVTEAYHWVPMLILVTLLGADHPPTSNDYARLGPFRWAIGAASLVIPILCFMPLPIDVN